MPRQEGGMPRQHGGMPHQARVQAGGKVRLAGWILWDGGVECFVGESSGVVILSPKRERGSRGTSLSLG
uniref:Uncharacterized protein n=1 Tax=viral metagenome TaxID=1070528 RepID=A0A6H2A2W2_9ZZZZ